LLADRDILSDAGYEVIVANTSKSMDRSDGPLAAILDLNLKGRKSIGRGKARRRRHSVISRRRRRQGYRGLRGPPWWQAFQEAELLIAVQNCRLAYSQSGTGSS